MMCFKAWRLCRCLLVGASLMRKIASCLVPRDRMACLELSTPPEQVLAAVRSGAHTRMPVYETELDNIVGIVNTKDLFYLFSLQGVVILQDALYAPLFLKPDESVSNALRLFKKSHRHMALVRDDGGRIHGLITLEDILEEIIGEFTTQSPLSTTGSFRRQPDGSIIVEGGTLLRDLNRKLGTRFPLGGPKTLNGLILEYFEDIPEAGTSMKLAGQPLEVVQIQDRVVKSVRLLPYETD